MSLLPGISGYTVVRDAIKLDYCVDLAIRSMLPVCDEVVVCESESTDGTLEMLQAMAAKEPKIRIIHRPWDTSVGNHEGWLMGWLNFTREHLRYDMQFTLDADEVLCPHAYPEMKRIAAAGKSAWYLRLNMWMDPFHCAPNGTVCGERVVRLGPTRMEMVSDGLHEIIPEIRKDAIRNPLLRIFHLGFLRKRQAFFDKSKIVQRALLNTYDARLERAEKENLDWRALCPFSQPLINYNGDHPEMVKLWCRERGYQGI